MFGTTDPENLENALLCSMTEAMMTVGTETLKPFLWKVVIFQ